MATGTATYSFNEITQVASGNVWQVQDLLTALAPSVNADKSLNYHTALGDAEHADVALGAALPSITLASKMTAPGEAVAGMATDMLTGQLGNQPPGMPSIQFDSTLSSLVNRAFATALTDVAASQDQPWFGWGATTSASTTYNYNLLIAYTSNTGTTTGYITILILGLTITVNLSQQQLLTLTPTASPTYTITAICIPGQLTGKPQPA